MYKGKFNQKQKGSSVEELLAQRSQTPAPALPELKPRKPQPRPAEQADAAQKPAPQKAAPAASQKPTPPKAAPQKKAAPAPKKKGPRLGGVIFYTLYFLFILVFFLATFVGLLWLKGWLVDFEASQPAVKGEQVFTQLFTSPDWGALYDAAGAKDSPYEGKSQYVEYMQEKVGGRALNYLETSAGLSGNKKYVVRLGDEKVASFTLMDKNKVGDTTLENINKLPDWQLGSVEVFFERSGSYRIQKMADHTAYVNNVALDDSFTIQKAATRAEEYLPAGVTSASTYVQEVTGLMCLPTVTVFDKQGNQVEVTYDEATRTFTARTESNTFSDPEQEQTALKAAETYCLFMIEKASRADLAKYFDTTGNAYKTFTGLGDLWMQGSAGHEFANEKVYQYTRYSDDIFSVRVALDLNVTRNDGTVKTYEYEQSLFFRKTDSGAWKAYEMTPKNVDAPMGQIRLTFMEGDTPLTSTFFETDASKIITPIISVPEGKVLTGWARKDVGGDGNVTYTLMFQPDPATGEVLLPEGTILEPMTLYALIENPDDAAAREVQPDAPAETTEVSE